MASKLNFIGDGWHCLASIGEWKNGLATQVLDAKSCEAQAANWPKDGRCCVGIDHYEDLSDIEKDVLKKMEILLPSDSYGLIDALEARPGGLWAHVGWTEMGLMLVTQLTYRFLSPVWLPSDCESDGENRLRPLKLLRASLTNEPGIKGNKPLVNRLPDGELPTGDTKKKDKPMLKNIALALGLAEDATEEAVLAEIAARDAKMTELENKSAAAETEALVNRVKAEREIDAAGIEKFRAACLKNREVAETLAEMLPKKQPDAQRKPLTNREGAKTPSDGKPLKNRLAEWRDMPAGEGKTKYQAEHADELLKLEREEKGAI